MRKKILLFLLFLLRTLNSFSQHSQSDFSYHTPDSLKALSKVSIWATHYYIHTFQSGGKISLNDENGNPTGFFADTCNFCKAALEGTAYVKDSIGNITVFNFAKRSEKTSVNCRACLAYSKSKLDVENWGKALWTKSSGFGDGVKNYKLIPYRTIAVDQKIIPYGTVLFIPIAKGKEIELSNGKKVIHDGYFFAGDTGSAIKNNHIDLFTGISEATIFPEIIPSKSFDAYIVTDKTIIDTLTKIQTK